MPCTVVVVCTCALVHVNFHAITQSFIPHKGQQINIVPTEHPQTVSLEEITPQMDPCDDASRVTLSMIFHDILILLDPIAYHHPTVYLPPLI